MDSSQGSGSSGGGLSGNDGVAGLRGGFFKLSPAETQLSSQARWFVYSHQVVSLASFSDPWFKEMLCSAGQVAILTRYMLLKYIEAEFAIFLVFLQLIVSMKLRQSSGMAFGQLIHDGGTAANKKKSQALGIQFIDPRWLCNLVICIGWVYCASNFAVDVAGLVDRTFIERTGHAVKNLCGLVVADRAALAVGDELGMDESEACDMHDGDKLGGSAVGKVVRSRKKKPVNPFTGGTDLMTLFHNVAKYFSYSTRLDALHALGRSLGDKQVPLIKFQLDLNGTRIAAEFNLLHSCVRLHKALRLYAMHNPGALPAISDDDWRAASEFEAVLHATSLITKLAQHEKLYNAAYGPLIKILCYNALTSQHLLVVSLSDVTAAPNMKRIPVRCNTLLTLLHQIKLASFFLFQGSGCQPD